MYIFFLYQDFLYCTQKTYGFLDDDDQINVESVVQFFTQTGLSESKVVFYYKINCYFLIITFVNIFNRYEILSTIAAKTIMELVLLIGHSTFVNAG